MKQMVVGIVIIIIRGTPPLHCVNYRGIALLGVGIAVVLSLAAWGDDDSGIAPGSSVPIAHLSGYLQG